MGVSRSGYYLYLRRGLSRRHEENRRLVEKIKQIWKEARGVYGSPRITAELCAQCFCLRGEPDSSTYERQWDQSSHQKEV